MGSRSRKRNTLICAGRLSWVSSQGFKYQTIFLLKSPKSYSAKIKIKLSYCTNTALVDKGLASCYIYTPKMIISKIAANGFLVSLHAFFTSTGKSCFLMFHLTPRCEKEHENSFKQWIVYLPNIINSIIESQANYQISSLILWVWFSP